VRVLNQADLRFLALAKEWEEASFTVEAYHFNIFWESKEENRFVWLTEFLLKEIRRRRSDLDLRALARLTQIFVYDLPSEGELLLLVTDARDVVRESVHAVETGRPGEYIASICPKLREDGRALALDAVREILKGSKRGIELIEHLTRTKTDSAHLDDIARDFKFSCSKVAKIRQQSARQLYYRTARILDGEKAPIRLWLDRGVIRISWRPRRPRGK
jgi:hypothetical protein